MDGIPSMYLQLGAVLALGTGLGWTVYASLAGDTVLRRYYGRYTAHLDRQLKLLFLPGSGQRIFLIQVVLAVVLLAAALFTQFYYLLGAMALVAIVPVLKLEDQRKRHVKKLEEQTDGLILGLANALKTVPSPSAAMESVVVVLPKPMQQEIDRLLKEMRVGSTLEQAILNMSSRLKSQEIDAALSSLLIGLQVGGNLPQVLETTAGTIREMARLQGVIRTKTADARVQLWVLAIFPFVICYGFTLLQPDFFWPLERTFIGQLITALAVVLWLLSLVTARKVLRVDI